MLKVNLRHLDEDDLHLQGELSLAELDFGVTDELVHLKEPLRYDLEVSQMHDSILATGSLRLALECECARCLQPFKREVQLDDWTVHLPLEGEDAVSIVSDCVDLTPHVREDMLLELPQHPLCKTDCAGLNKKSEARKTGDDDKSKPSPWGELDKLKI